MMAPLNGISLPIPSCQLPTHPVALEPRTLYYSGATNRGGPTLMLGFADARPAEPPAEDSSTPRHQGWGCTFPIARHLCMRNLVPPAPGRHACCAVTPGGRAATSPHTLRFLTRAAPGFVPSPGGPTRTAAWWPRTHLCRQPRHGARHPSHPADHPTIWTRPMPALRAQARPTMPPRALPPEHDTAPIAQLLRARAQRPASPGPRTVGSHRPRHTTIACAPARGDTTPMLSGNAAAARTHARGRGLLQHLRPQLCPGFCSCKARPAPLACRARAGTFGIERAPSTSIVPRLLQLQGQASPTGVPRARARGACDRDPQPHDFPHRARF